MSRRKRTTLQRAAIFDAHNGKCHICGEKIDGTREAWELEHIVPFDLTRDDTDENLAPAHVVCHRQKTKQDKTIIAKSNRVAAKHKGARAPKTRLPGSKGSGWRKPLNGPAYRVKE